MEGDSGGYRWLYLAQGGGGRGAGSSGSSRQGGATSPPVNHFLQPTKLCYKVQRQKAKQSMDGE